MRKIKPVDDYFIRVIASDVADEVRVTGKAPLYGHPAHVETATGYGPCRLCLQKFAIGVERRILFTFDPFWSIERFPLPGPVYIHESACRPYSASGRFPQGLHDLPLTLNAYRLGRILRAQVRIDPHDQPAREVQIERLLKRSDVDYIHVRNTAAGCYMFGIDRAS